MRAPCHRDKISVKRSTTTTTTTTALKTTSLLMAVEMGLFFSFGQSFHCAISIFSHSREPRTTSTVESQTREANKTHCHICCLLIFFPFRCVSTYKTGNNETIKIQLNGKAKCKLCVHFSSTFSLPCNIAVLTIHDLILLFFCCCFMHTEC